MANIAQLVNVLQAVLLTEGDKMIKTPTYYVFRMYNAHQDAELLESSIDTKMIGLEEGNMVPNLTESVSKDKDGKIHITITNLSIDEDYDIQSDFLGKKVVAAKASVLKGKMDDRNTFDAPEAVKEEVFEGLLIEEDRIRYTIPASSVMSIEVTV